MQKKKIITELNDKDDVHEKGQNKHIWFSGYHTHYLKKKKENSVK